MSDELTKSSLLTEDFVSKWTKNRILHFDLDCFYAAVEMRDNPSLLSVPLGIGGPANTRSVLCTANYLARSFGVRSGMASSVALKKCPKLLILEPNFKKYKAASRDVFEIFHHYTDQVEGLSLDEAFLDITHLPTTVLARDIAKEIKHKVFQKTGLTISAGASFNKFLAKVASDWKKPDGLFIIPPAHRQAFVKDLDIKYVFGIGQKSKEKLNSLNIHKCSDIQAQSLASLRRAFGSRYLDMYYMSHGLDFRQVSAGSLRKSYTSEETLSENVSEPSLVMQTLFRIYHHWLAGFKKYQSKQVQEDSRISALMVKVKYFDFKQTTHECRYRGDLSFPEFQKLLEDIIGKRSEPVRLLGLGVRLESSRGLDQMSLL